MTAVHYGTIQNGWPAMKVQCCFNYFTFDEIKQVNEYVVEKSINTTAANFVKLF